MRILDEVSAGNVLSAKVSSGKCLVLLQASKCFGLVEIFCARPEIYLHNSGVHVLLVSLLVDQLSGLFFIFLVDQKKICPVSDLFCSLS